MDYNCAKKSLRNLRLKELDDQGEVMLQLIILFLVFLIPVQGRADQIDDAIAAAGLVEDMTHDAKIYSGECHQSGPAYVVERHGGSIRINRKRPADAEPKPEFSAGLIKYVWENHGEFGGKLDAIWPDKHKKTLLEENIVSLIQSGEFLYVFTGLRHMEGKGAVYRISDFDKNPKVSRVTLLPGKPLALLDSRRETTTSSSARLRLIYSPVFFIITDESLLALNPDAGWLRIITHHPLWEELLPNSAVQEGERIVIGICPGVAVIEFYNNYYLKSIRMFVPERTKLDKTR